MKTRLFLVPGRDPEARARRIEALLSEQAGVGKITLMASTEVFSYASVEAQAELFRLTPYATSSTSVISANQSIH